MSFLSLYYFLIVAEELNFTKAAKRLFVSQQSISQHIKKLEAEYGVKLFFRKPKLSLTYAGMCMVNAAKKILEIENYLKDELNEINNEARGKLVIGISPRRGRELLPNILPEYREHYPNVELNIVEGNTSELKQKLLNKEVDLIISIDATYSEEIQKIDIYKEYYLLIVPHTIMKKLFPKDLEARVSEFEKGVDISFFKTCPFLLTSKETRQRLIVDEYLKKNNITPKIILDAKNVDTILLLVSEGIGIGFCPHTFMKEHNIISIKNVYFFPLNDCSTENKIVIAYKKNKYLTKYMKHFIKLTQDYCKLFSSP